MVIISGENLCLEDLYRVLIQGEKIELDEKSLSRVHESYFFLKEFIKDKLIYGINTGFGPMAQYRISNEDQLQLQYNLIRSHCSGSGQVIPGLYAKSVMVARLSTLLCGYSGIHVDVVLLLKELINRDIYPVLFEHGGLGASGDLVQLAHVALTLIGEGEVHYKGKVVSCESAFAAEGLTPLKMHIREGLALMNGTSCMSGIGALNLMHSWNLVNWSIAASAMIVEIVESYDDHYSNELNGVKRHTGQNTVARVMQNFLTDSRLVKSREEHLYSRKVDETVVKEKVQEYYSIRCVPQILGPVVDTISFAEKIVLDEINSANDNPIIDYKSKNVYHGGNFHGDYVALEMDKLKIAVTKLCMLSERQLNFLLNDKLNGKLPPFVNLGTLGLNLGMQGVQFTATSTTAENQTLSMPMYIHSIPSNNDNQDIVSMGSNAALLARKVINNTYEVMAIEFMAIMQAVDALGFAEKLSSPSRQIYKEIREVFPRFEKDSVRYKEIKNVRNYLRNKRFPKELSVQ
jgi:histidine ammonia-lyase